MATELLDVVDTAVKIGLGALITGCATYMVNSTNNRNDRDKYLLEHKINTLETSAGKVDEYFDAWSGLITIVGGISRRMEEAGEPLNVISKARMNQIKERDRRLVDSWPSKSQALSRFRLLGAQNVIEAINKSNKPQRVLRNKVIFDKEIPSYEEFKAMRSDLNQIKEIVHSEISAFYNDLGA
ncbi:hypothetical protein ACFIOZ_16750 [Vreelandella sp. F11]|uniref:hypothetical protein n=1 Tax=Vreelandella sp. F11 TaxID=3394751 RepID=UPI0036DCA3CC